jgi:hypothetical protein
MWTDIRDVSALDAAMKLTRGCYQRNLLRGYESLSGSTLKGRAKEYGGRYQRSACSLLRRMTAAGVAWTEERGTHGRRILVIG